MCLGGKMSVWQKIASEVEIKVNNQKLHTLGEMKKIVSNKDSGFYWIYTKIPAQKFLDCSAPDNLVHIDFSELAKVNLPFEWTIKQFDDDYWCVYNGKGKALRDRLSAAFTNTQGATGKLALERCFEVDEFRVKFIICDSSDEQYGIRWAYAGIERDLERVWRLNNGWPFLCRT